MRKKLLWVALAAVLVFLPATALAASFKAGDVVDLQKPVTGDAFLSGRLVTLDQEIEGEAFLAGETINVKSTVKRSVWAAGNSVTVMGAGYNAFLAGNTLNLSGEYGNDVYAAGNTITLDTDTHIRGDLRLAGTQVIINGTVDGDVYVDANVVDFDATVGGMLKGSVYQLNLNGGSIAGDLTYKSDRDAKGLGNTEVGGTVLREPFNEIPYWQIRLTGFLVGLITLLVLGAALIALSRKRIQALADDTVSKRGPLAGVGVITLLLTPIVIFGLFLSVIGITLALVLLTFYIFALLVATVPAVLSLGEQVASWLRWKISSPFHAFFIGAIAYLVAIQIPILGFFAGLAYFAFFYLPAVGALAARFIERKR